MRSASTVRARRASQVLAAIATATDDDERQPDDARIPGQSTWIRNAISGPTKAASPRRPRASGAIAMPVSDAGHERHEHRDAMLHDRDARRLAATHPEGSQEGEILRAA